MEKSYLNLVVTDTGHVSRKVGETLIPVKLSYVGNKGHVIFTSSGKTIYLARLVYCLFNGIEYDDFKGRIRYRGAYSDCSLSNIFSVDKHEVKPVIKKDRVDPWAVRSAYCAGVSVSNISGLHEISEQRVKQVCIGFESVSFEQNQKIIEILKGFELFFEIP